jgi:2-polyprenyl-6-methoxyphenol hydroxylase-like FAD-dependent oxidoreductase
VHNETGVQSVDQDAGRAWAVTTTARTFQGDVVVGADGHRSVVRAHVSPERPEAAFAGYMIWLGLSQESGMPSVRRWPEDTAMLSPDDSYFFGYPVADVNGAFVPGARELMGLVRRPPERSASRDTLRCRTGRAAFSDVRSRPCVYST